MIKLLTHPNIPKPLHGMAPRIIMGNAWWQKQRQIAIAENDSRCWACGVHLSQAEFHNWLEVHESYDIDFAKGVAKYEKAVALCHACHQFIHSGRLLSVLQKDEISYSKVYRIVDRGLSLCFEHNETPYIGLKPLVDYLELDWSDYWEPKEYAQWNKWKLIFNGKEYPTKYPTIFDWATKYNAEITEDDRKYGYDDFSY